MPGLFATGSAAIEQPMSTRPPAAPVPTQLPDAYRRQVFANQERADADLKRDIARDAAAGRARDMALTGTWPGWMPEGVRTAVAQALAAESQARGAYRAAEQEAELWIRQHPTASEAMITFQREKLTIEQATAGQHAVSALDRVLAHAGEVLETLEQQVAIIAGDAAKRAAEDRRHAQAINGLDTELTIARQITARFGVHL